MRIVALFSVLFMALPAFAETSYLVACKVVEAGPGASWAEANYSLQQYTWLTVVDPDSLAERAFNEPNMGGLTLPLQLGVAGQSLSQNAGWIRVQLHLELEGFHLNTRLAVTVQADGKSWTSDQNIVATDKLAVACHIDSVYQ